MLAALLLIATGWLLGRFVDASLRRLIHGVLHPFAKRSGRTAERDLAAERIGASFGLVGTGSSSRCSCSPPCACSTCRFSMSSSPSSAAICPS